MVDPDNGSHLSHGFTYTGIWICTGTTLSGSRLRISDNLSRTRHEYHNRSRLPHLDSGRLPCTGYTSSLSFRTSIRTRPELNQVLAETMFKTIILLTDPHIPDHVEVRALVFFHFLTFFVHFGSCAYPPVGSTPNGQ
jgi:hypothetical protein